MEPNENYQPPKNFLKSGTERYMRKTYNSAVMQHGMATYLKEKEDMRGALEQEASAFNHLLIAFNNGEYNSVDEMSQLKDELVASISDLVKGIPFVLNDKGVPILPNYLRDNPGSKLILTSKFDIGQTKVLEAPKSEMKALSAPTGDEYQ